LGTEKLKKKYTITSMAAELRMSRTTLQSYLKMPGAPKEGSKGWDFAAVSKFISEKAKTSAAGAKSNPDIAAKKLELLSLQCARLAHKLETEKGLHIPKSVIGPSMRNAHDHWRAEFEKAEQELPARLVNRTENEIGRELQARFDKIFTNLESNTRQWMQAPLLTTLPT
jgi:hypothetical protein